MIKPKYLLLSFILVFLFVSCKSHKNSTYNSIDNTPKILFLNYSIIESSNGARTIQFNNKKIVNGKIKRNDLELLENGVEGDLIFTELNSKSKIINQMLIKNPLIKNIEFVNESKKFQTQVVKLDKTQFSIRLQLKNETKLITISNFATNNTLIKTQIN
ncbi:hypothetical protein [Algibacter pectinivorans]|uniref:Lipoprotein n=1 Tax=Algibacter pectinivorans TaxID=870482 RepID=A0A1I1MBP5_9FLAO|nr:hypothetical protein [Algibacter pectinivorans]SFC82789.1 hypothetical protein SAMN04487987_101157 [Algibacter pectinivorans]